MIFKEIEINDLEGTIVGVPVVNVPSLLRKKRRFIDGKDLNHIMPGKENGTAFTSLGEIKSINDILKRSLPDSQHYN